MLRRTELLVTVINTPFFSMPYPRASSATYDQINSEEGQVG